MEENGTPDNAGLRWACCRVAAPASSTVSTSRTSRPRTIWSWRSNGLRLFVDPFSMQYLGGVEIDYVTTFQGSGFTFNNPNASGGCGCGSSFTV
jgi:iron-sulfur cluster assembly accessory protein